MDISITVLPGLIKVPFEELVVQMKTMITSVYPDIAKRGLLNARLSRKYLAERPEKPEHVLNFLAKSLAQEGGIQKVEQAPEIDLSNIMEALPESTVVGRMSEVMLMEDGTYVPIEKQSEPRESSHRAGGWRASYPFQNAPDPTIPAEYLVKTIATGAPEMPLPNSSSETTADNFVRNMQMLQSTPPSFNTPSTNANGASQGEQPSDGFDWLFGDELVENSPHSESSNHKEPAKEGAQKVALNWPPPKARD